MKTLILVFVLATKSIFAMESFPKYPVVTQGRKVNFDGIQKSDLGKTMSLYLLPGRQKIIQTGIIPDGALNEDKEKKINIWTGELHAILKDGLRLRWYYDAERTSSSEYGAAMEDIAYILIRD